MPHKSVFVAAALVLSHQGVNVYRAYYENDADDPAEFKYMLKSQGDYHDSAFDIRELTTYDHNERDHIEALTAAIEKGELVADGEDEGPSFKIELVWSTEDVIQHAKQEGYICSFEQARDILGEIDRHHDCNNGVTWDTLSYCIMATCQEDPDPKNSEDDDDE